MLVTNTPEKSQAFLAMLGQAGYMEDEIILADKVKFPGLILGIAGGAWLHEKHERIRRRLKERTAEIFGERGVKEPQEPPPSVIVPLLTEAQKESREELLDLWAKLIAASMDPTMAHLYRREYVEIVRRLEPLDAKILKRISTLGQIQISVRNALTAEMNVNPGEIEVSLRNLAALDLVTPASSSIMDTRGSELTALGGELLRALGR